MNKYLELIISLIIFLIIITIKIISNRKNSNDYVSSFTSRIKKANILFIILSIIAMIAVFFTNHYLEEEKSIYTNIINSLSIGLLIFPLSSLGFTKSLITKEDKLTKITNVVTDIIDEKYTKLFNRAGIHLIVLNKTKPKYIKESITEKEYLQSMLTKNIHIKTSTKDILSRMKNEKIAKEFTSLEDLYNRLIEARGMHDNFIRIIKYNLLTYLPLFIGYIVLKINGFPFSYSLLLLMILKLLTSIVSESVYKKMKYDTDISDRKPLRTDLIFGFQEAIILAVEIFTIMICLTVPYMFLLAQGGTIELSNTILYAALIYTNILFTISLYSEQFLLINLFKIFKHISILIYIIIGIALSILFNYFHYFKTMNIGLKNYFGALVMSLFAIIAFELIKLMRLTTVKGAKKNESNNYKKPQRS